MASRRHQLFQLPVLIYILKCLIGLCICYALYIAYPQHQFYWSMISVLLSFAPDENHSNWLAYDRIKANVAGSVIGLLLYLIHTPTLIFLCLGVIIVIVVGTLLQFENATRSALAAMMIVMLYEQQQSTWHVALERMFCVIVGCVIALAITLLFSFAQRHLMRRYKKSPPHKRRANQPT